MCGRNKKVEKRKIREMAVSRAPRGWEEVKAVNWAVDKKERLGKRGRDGNQPQKSQRNGTKEIPLVVESIWESGAGKNAGQKGLGPCNRCKGGLQA